MGAAGTAGRAGRIAIVLGGYVAALVAASVATAIRVRLTSGPDSVASSGMYAFGDAVVFVAVFGAVALVPTVLALRFLRSHAAFWAVLSVTALVIAATGPLGALPVAWDDFRRMSGTAGGAQGAYGFLRVMIAWCLAPGFVVTAFLAPPGRPRQWLSAAAGLECLTAAYLVVHFFFARP